MNPAPPSRPSLRAAGGTPARPLGAARTPAPVAKSAAKPGAPSQPTSSSVDHWTMVLFYALGAGTLALILFFILSLALIGLYGQFVWSFTHWDLTSFQSEMVKPWAHFTMLIVFGSGTCVGIWFFGGYAWKNLKNRRIVNAATRARRNTR